MVRMFLVTGFMMISIREARLASIARIAIDAEICW
jgi:hypothetical protein